MATIPKTLIPSGIVRILGVKWLAMGDADVGEAMELSKWQDRTVQVEGTFGGATLVIEGTIDGENWQTLRDPGGTALSFTAAGLKSILELPRLIRPSTSGGTGTSLNVWINARGDTY